MSHSRGFSSGESSSSGSNSSGFSDQSPLPPSVTDRGSHGEIPGQPFSEEASQHFYKLSNSSRSDWEIYISGSVEMDFYSMGIFYSLTVSDMERI